MNTQRMAAIIADPAALQDLKTCSSLSEMIDRLNRSGAECTREEGLRFLRTWEKLEEDEEDDDSPEKADRSSGGRPGLVGFLKSIFNRGSGRDHHFRQPVRPAPLTIEKILQQMNTHS